MIHPADLSQKPGDLQVKRKGVTLDHALLTPVWHKPERLRVRTARLPSRLAVGYRGLHVEGRFLWLRRPCHLPAFYSPNVVERLYEKASRAGQSPQHEANHASIYERFAARTPPLVVPKLILRLWSIQAKERSTTRRRGKT